MKPDDTTHPQPTADQPPSITQQLWDRGVRHLPPDDLNALASRITHDVEMHVGQILCDQLTPAQINEFDALHDLTLQGTLDEQALREWIARAVPNYTDITRRVINQHLTEVVSRLNETLTK